jgi:DNA-nicking Smr family endonuclease
MTRKREKPLAPEDRILWETVARTVTPLDAARAASLQNSQGGDQIIKDAPIHHPRSGPAARDAAPMPLQPSPAPLALSKRLIGSLAMPATKPKAALQSAINRIEPALLKRIAKGRLEVEAKIDLHGMTQDEAYMLLYGFLSEAAARHLRTVLVITGKGRSLKSEGALKRAVPIWLAQPLFARLTSGYSDAAQGHGGEGALYVRIKPTAIK